MAVHREGTAAAPSGVGGRGGRGIIEVRQEAWRREQDAGVRDGLPFHSLKQEQSAAPGALLWAVGGGGRKGRGSETRNTSSRNRARILNTNLTL